MPRVVNSILNSASSTLLDSLPGGCNIIVAVLVITHPYTPLSNGNNKEPFPLDLFGRAEKMFYRKFDPASA